MDSEPTTSNSMNAKKRLITSFVAILSIVIIAEGVTFFNHKHTEMDASSSIASPTSSTSTPAAATNSSSTATYKDGSYTTSGSYLSPGGQETINVSVTLKDSTVTATSIKQTADNQVSSSYQADFKQNFQKQVVGKKISTINLSRVSGSSLTSQGFNQALKQIETKAQA